VIRPLPVQGQGDVVPCDPILRVAWVQAQQTDDLMFLAGAITGEMAARGGVPPSVWLAGMSVLAAGEGQ